MRSYQSVGGVWCWCGLLFGTGTGGFVFGSVVYGGEILHLRGGNMYLELVQMSIFFLVLLLYNRIMLLTAMTVIIFQYVLRFIYVLRSVVRSHRPERVGKNIANKIDHKC